MSNCGSAGELSVIAQKVKCGTATFVAYKRADKKFSDRHGFFFPSRFFSLSVVLWAITIKSNFYTAYRQRK